MPSDDKIPQPEEQQEPLPTGNTDQAIDDVVGALEQFAEALGTLRASHQKLIEDLERGRRETDENRISKAG